MELQIIQNKTLRNSKRKVLLTISEQIKIYDENMSIVGEVLASSGVSIATGKLKLRIKIFDDKMKERYSKKDG